MATGPVAQTPQVPQGYALEGQEPAQQSSGLPAGYTFDDPSKQHINMVGPRGEQVVVLQPHVSDMRKQNFAVTPDNPGVQKMVTADGKVAYALPHEVQDFEDNGATKILPDGRFEVKNLRSDGSEFPDSVPDVRERAVNVAKALGAEQMKKSVAAEQEYWTSKEGLKQEAKGLGNVAIVGGGTMAALAAPGVTARIFAPTTASGLIGAGGEEIAGSSLARQALSYVGRKLLEHKIGVAGTTAGIDILGRLKGWW